MGFYIRKSVKFGPLRLNLSKSGLGVSAGVKGFRIGSGPKGNYVHVGRGGLYYKKSLGSSSVQNQGRQRTEQEYHEQIGDQQIGMQEIESKDTAQIVDGSSEFLVNEIRKKASIPKLWPWITISVFILSIFSFNTSEIMGGILLFFAPLLGISVAMVDRRRKTTIILYDLDVDTEREYSDFFVAFENLKRSQRKWHIEAKADVKDMKYHAGAGELVRRKRVDFKIGSPKDIKTNLPVPSIPVGKQTLYFLPDKLLVVEKRNTGAVSYSNLEIEVISTKFIETEDVPSDSEIVDYTWKYVNKKGGPDKRFKNNPKLPIALYAQIDLISKTGLQERLNISNIKNAEAFSKAMNKLSTYYREIE